jgi:hypothetical protein
MIADRRGIVLHCIHGGDYRICAVARNARSDVGERISLEQISGVEQYHSSRIGSANGIDDRCGASKPANGFGLIGVVIPGPEPTVDIGSGGYEQVDRVSRPRQTPRCTGQYERRNEPNPARSHRTEKLFSPHELQS